MNHFAGWLSQTLRETTNRFGPWLTAALCARLATGILMVVGEPVRELVTVSFWLEMFLLAVGILVAAASQLWLAIVIPGRLIAFDHVWGAWSPAQKA